MNRYWNILINEYPIFTERNLSHAIDMCYIFDSSWPYFPLYICCDLCYSELNIIDTCSDSETIYFAFECILCRESSISSIKYFYNLKDTVLRLENFTIGAMSHDQTVQNFILYNSCK